MGERDTACYYISDFLETEFQVYLALESKQ